MSGRWSSKTSFYAQLLRVSQSNLLYQPVLGPIRIRFDAPPSLLNLEMSNEPFHVDPMVSCLRGVQVLLFFLKILSKLTNERIIETAGSIARHFENAKVDPQPR